MDHQTGRKQAANSPEVAIANEVFDQFCNATTLKSILGHFRHLCELLKIRPNAVAQFYPKLKSKLRSWKAQALWKKFDQRANHKCYNRGKACPNTRVLIIGGGPCGLRSAIEAQLLGAKVVVVEKRDRMSRNNVLHLWPFVIQDLRALGAKKFFGKFCAGSIDHISIRQLQCILLKVALILGVEFHESVSFDSLIPPPENQEEGKIGWRAKTTPADHPVSQYEFDVLIGADGKRNTLEGFKRKEFRGKLAIAITANFINKRTEAEARVEEISGVAFIFNQKFFKELYQETGIDLENIVYYKDDTHYFVMTAKKHSLIDKGVILQDHADTAKLLAKENVDREALMLYAREAAEFSTEYQMMDMEFAVNHYGQPDVAMFDFTSMYAAENASRILERRGHRLLMILVGDSLLEPFWPTGSGCARGFLSSMDACWAIKQWGASMTPLEVIAERESIYRLLGQTTPENLNRDYAAYTLDPHTRYPNLNVSSVTPIQVRSLLDTDDPDSIKQPPLQSDVDIPKKRRRRDLRGDSQIHPDMLLRWLQKQVALYDSVQIEDMGGSFKNGLAICAIIHRYRPDLIDFHSLDPKDTAKNNQLAFDVLEKELGITPIMTGEEMVQSDVPDKLAMFSYLTQIYEVFRGEIPYVRHPKLEPENEERPAHSKQLSQLTPDQKVHLLDRIVRQDSATRTRHSRSRHNENLNPVDKKGDTISRRSRKRRSTEKMGVTVDREPKIHAGHRRNSIDEEFSGRIKSIEDKLKGSTPSERKPRDLLRAIGKIEKTDWNVKEIEKKIEENKMGRSARHDKVERVPKWSREQFLARQIKMEKKGRDQKETDSKYADIDNTLKSIDRKIKEGNVLGHNKVSAMAEQFSNKNQDAEPRVQKSNVKPTITLPTQGGSEMCHFCNKRVYLMERLTAEGKFFHRGCFRCEYCSTSLRLGNHTFDREKNGGRFYCTQHFGFPGTIKARAEKKRLTSLNKENIPNVPVNVKTPEKTKIPLEGVVGLDLLDRGQTPERIEFENLAGISDAEEPQSQMDEDEWTDRNFGASTAEMGSSDDISDMSDSDDDNEVYEEAIDQPLTTEGTLELAKNWTLRYSHPQTALGQSDTGSNEYEDSSDEYTNEDDESTTATEDEEDMLARERRRQEVWLKHPTRSSDTDTGSETEVKISQDSVDNVIEEPFVLHESVSVQDPNLMSSEETNMSNRAVIEKRDIHDQDSNTETPNTDTSVAITNQVGDTIRSEASGSIIPISDSSFDLISSNAVNTAGSSEAFLVPSNYFVAKNLQKDNNNEECILEYENLIEESVLPKLNEIHETLNALPKVNENEKDSLILEFNGNDELNETLVSMKNETNKLDFSNDELTPNVISVNDKSNNSVTLGLDVLASETSNALNTELQTAFAGIMLPDAIPVSQSNYNNTMRLNTEDSGSFKDKLPDLINSSPNRSRESSPSSSSEIYRSTETLYEELNASDSQDKFNAEGLESNDTIKYKELEREVSRKKGRLNIAIESIKQVPIVTVTSPSPTNEKPAEKSSLEVAKLTVPKEAPNKSVQSDGNSSFDKLKRDLRQRKAKNKIPVGELRPLSRENAQEKMTKYFVEEKKRKVTSQNKESSDVKIVELDIKPKLSTKVEAKDIMKYFQKAKRESFETVKDTESPEMFGKEREIQIGDDDEIDAINQQFEQIEHENEEMYLLSAKDIESKLHFDTPFTGLQLGDAVEQNDVDDIMQEVNEFKSSEVPEEIAKVSIVQSYGTNEEKTDISHNKISLVPRLDENILETKLCEGISNITVDSQKNDEVKANEVTLISQFDVATKTNLHESKKDSSIHCDEINKINPTLTSQLDKALMASNLRRDEADITVNSFEGINTNQITPQLSKIKLANVLHASDGSLNVRKETDEMGKFRKNSKSSYELNLPTGPVTKVKVTKQNIEAPKRVSKINISNENITSNVSDETPKRPERKHAHREFNHSTESLVSSAQTVPEVPTRKRSARRKPVAASPSRESTSNVQSNPGAVNERLIASNEHENSRRAETDDLKSIEVSSNSEGKKILKVLDNSSTEQKHSHPAKSPPPIKPDQHESTKSVPPRNDRSKKEKCVVS